MTPLSLAQGGSILLPQEASTYAAGVDWLFYLILAICAFFFFLILVLVVYFAIRFRARPGHVAQPSPSHSTGLELTWTIIPTIIVVVLFYLGFRTYIDIITPPPQPYQINVTARKWSWSFTYPNGHVDNNLYLPKDTPVLLVLQSEDVIHSLYVPAFRVKRDCVPGRYNKMWVQATQTGEFQLFCAEYCGTRHSTMLAKVHVKPQPEFAQWLSDAGNWVAKMPPAEAGAKLFAMRGCNQCHSIDGSGNTGPTLKNVFGYDVPLKDGSAVRADEDFIRESILNPSAKIVKGYENVMPSFQGQFKDNEISAVIAYLQSLSDKAPSTQTPGTSGAPGAPGTAPAAEPTPAPAAH